MTTYFVLQPPSWEGASSHLCRPLVGPRHDRISVPWVAVARSEKLYELSLVRLDEIDGDQARALIEQAGAWIARNAREWQVIEKSGFFRKKPSMVRAINGRDSIGLTSNPMDDLSSEQLVSPRAMLDACGPLEALDLMVAIPKRGWLVAAPGKPGDIFAAKRMLELSHGVYGRAAPEDALTPDVFMVSAGAIIGRCGLEGGESYVSLSRVDETAWNIPTALARYSSAQVEHEVLRLVEQGSGRWGWKDIAIRMDGSRLPSGFNLVTTLRALVERGELDELDVDGHPRWRIATGPRTPKARRIHTIGRRLHRLVVELPASSEWQDTGLAPDVLATRPVILGMTTKLLWKAVPIEGARVDPIVELRHVADPSLTTRSRTFTYAAPDERPVVASGVPVRVAGTSIRFPREPGRIQARIAGASGTREIYEIAGTLRLELLAPIAGEGDEPLRAPLDKLVVENTDDFSPLAPLAAVDPPMWTQFRA
ncbi:MAG: hypothetical protein AB7T06_30720 [Kofleriaceae bacterium]